MYAETCKTATFAHHPRYPTANSTVQVLAFLLVLLTLSPFLAPLMGRP